MPDDIDTLMRYEQGDMTPAEIVTLFQSLIDSGLVWQLQGTYGRTAQRLIAAGLVHLPSPNRGTDHE